MSREGTSNQNNFKILASAPGCKSRAFSWLWESPILPTESSETRVGKNQVSSTGLFVLIWRSEPLKFILDREGEKRCCRSP